MPAVPVAVLAPVGDQCSGLRPEHPVVDPAHPLGCHRCRLPDRVVVDPVGDALGHGSGDERIASAACAERTSRRRRREWAAAGLAQPRPRWVLEHDDRMIGLEREDVVGDGGLTKAPCGGEAAGRSPVDRGQQGRKRSPLGEATGGPLHVVAAGANRHDAPLLGSTLAGLAALGPLPGGIAAHLDRGDDGRPSRDLLAALALTGVIAQQGTPAPRQAGKRWVVERTNSWMNGSGKLRRCTERRAIVVDFYRFLAAALVVTRRLIQRARTRYRWDGRPTTRRLK